MPLRFVPGKGVVQVDDNGQEVATNNAPQQAAMPNSPFGQFSASGQPVPNPFGNASGKDVVKGGLRVAGNALELGAGMIPGIGIPSRIAIAALSGGAGGALRGEDPIQSAENNAAIEGGMGLLGKAIPPVMNTAAYLFGGLSPTKAINAAKDLGKANEGRGLYSWLASKLGGDAEGGLRLAAGREGPLNKVIDQGNTALQTAEEANPTRVKLGEAISGRIEGAGGDLGQSSILRKGKDATTSMDPHADRQRMYGKASNYYDAQLKEHPTGDVSMRELGDLKRTRAREGRKTYDMRAAGEIPTSKQEKEAELQAALAKGHQRVQEHYDRPVADQAEKNLTSKLREVFSNSNPNQGKLGGEVAKDSPTATGPIRDANTKLETLFKVKGANKQTRGASFIGEPGKMAARGGLGAGIGLTIGGPVGAGVGSVAGPILFSPTGASMTGHAASTAADLTPTALRANWFAQALEELNKKKENQP